MNVILLTIKSNDMKIRLLFMSLALLFSVHLYAQSSNSVMIRKEKKMYVSLGVVGGFDMSTILTQSPVEAQFGMRPGFNAGLAANFRFCKRNSRSSAKTGLLAFQPELRYATMGGNIDNSSLGLHYITVPVMFQVYPTKRFYVEAGPEFALPIAHTPDNIAVSSFQMNLIDLQPNDIMLGVGVGFILGGFNVGVRYNQGFSDYASNLPWKNSLFQFNLGYLFQLNKNKGTKKIIDF